MLGKCKEAGPAGRRGYKVLTAFQWSRLPPRVLIHYSSWSLLATSGNLARASDQKLRLPRRYSSPARTSARRPKTEALSGVGLWDRQKPSTF